MGVQYNNYKLNDSIERIIYSIVSPQRHANATWLDLNKNPPRIWTQRPIIRSDNKNGAFIPQAGYVNEYDNVKFNINGAEIVESRW